MALDTALWTSTLAVTAGPHANMTIPINAVANAASLVVMQSVNLASGDNTFAVPVVAGVVFTRVSLIPPTGNMNLVKLKKLGTDAGVELHKTDPTSLGIDGGFSQIILNAAALVNDYLIIWS